MDIERPSWWFERDDEKEYEIIETKSYYVYANNKEEALEIYRESDGEIEHVEVNEI